MLLADGVLRRGGTPTVVLLTDGRANIGRDGSPGREKAQADAVTAARRARVAQLTALLVDTSPRPQALALALAQEMGARYLPLPHADGAARSKAARLGASGR